MEPLEFSEAGCAWRQVPAWAAFLIEFGYRWMGTGGNSRRLALISMPTDSAASGLITLGLIRKCMELENATDVGVHHQRLVEMARTRPRDVELRHINWPGRFMFDGFNPEDEPMVKKFRCRNRQRVNIPRPAAFKWRVDGESPVFAGQKLPHTQFYEHLVTGGGIIQPSNLMESHSNVCLAGRTVGEEPTKEWMKAIRFRVNDIETDLSQLLTVQNWTPHQISRVRFYNSRTGEFDRKTGMPHVIVSDGDSSFLKILSEDEFGGADVIGVLHKTLEREKLEAVGTRLESLRQWYGPDESFLHELPLIPRGISISIMRRFV